MKKFTKLLGIVLILTLVMSMGITAAFAQTVEFSPADADNAKITITNAANGETYKIAKLFDATVTGTTGGSIAYQGDIPEALAAYFTEDSAGNISATDALVLTNETVQTALKDWAEANVTAQAVSNGETLEFTKLPYGYYIITTTQGETLLTVDSTNPNASVIDKNTTIPINNPTKTADDKDVFIGQTVTYTVSFGTASYDGEKQIIEYKIEDTLPDYLEGVTVTTVKVIETAGVEDDPNTEANETVAEVSTDLTSLGADFATSKTITIPWIDNAGANLYKNGSIIEITYTAKVNDKAVVDGDGNKNAVTITYTTEDGEPHQDTQKVEETIYTYAVAIQKVDENKKPLAGAKFAVNGLSVTGSAGDYIVTAYDATSTTPGTEMECDAQGQLVIRGLATDTPLTLTETAAPAGYNKLTESITTLKGVKIGEEVKSEEKTIYYDTEGKVTDEQTETSYTKTTYNVDLLKAAVQVINNKGTELPSTGGIGTTIFYVVGSVLVIAAGILLITKKRMGRE